MYLKKKREQQEYAPEFTKAAADFFGVFLKSGQKKFN